MSSDESKNKKTRKQQKRPRACIPRPHDYIGWHVPIAAKANGHGDCRLCGGRCCTYLVVQIDTPRTKVDVDEIRWWLAHHNVQVYIDNDDRSWNVQFHTPCKFLTRAGRCRNYAGRFNVCREHDRTCCEMSSAQMAELCFATVEQFDAYWFKRKPPRRRPRPRRPSNA